MFQNVQPSDHRIPQGSSGVTQAAAHTAVTRVVLADPAPVVLAGLRTFLCEAQGFEVVGETTTSDDLLELLARVKPDIVAVDAGLCRNNTATSIAELRHACPGALFVVLSEKPSIDGVQLAFDAGACGFVVKRDDALDLPDIVRRIASGRTYISSSVSQLMLNRGDAGAHGATTASLTRREQEILELIVQGKNSRQIGEALGIRLRTVHTHRSRIMAKLDVHTATGLVSTAISNGLVQV